jgi:hypothetical protein
MLDKAYNISIMHFKWRKERKKIMNAILLRHIYFTFSFSVRVST